MSDPELDADMESGGGPVGKKGASKKLLQDPLMLMDMAHDHHGKACPDFVCSLPKIVQKRIKALKKLQRSAVSVEAEFYQKVHELECAYAEKFKPMNDKREQIVNGTYEPNEEECDYPSDTELSEKLEKGATLNGPPTEEVKAAEKKEEAVAGVPEFWLTIFKNVEILAEMIQEHDEPILKHLLDIDVLLAKEPMGFTLQFHFSPNEHFTNTVLTKEYSLNCSPDEEDPFEFDGPEIISCKGCKIEWKPGKNITVKLIKKKQKHKTKQATRFITKQVKNDSFFNFFEPPAVPEATEEIDDETRELLNADFEIGQILRDRIVPRAILYFTGEAHDEDSFDGDDEQDDEDFDEDEDLDDDDDEDQPQV